ncbi:MAG: GGDEF domain-containing protein [Clostridia bacterium]|nr:GGDEF domain-containing protein [Clostridia bacterium]
MEKSTDVFIQLEDAASELMRPSDYLTEEAQCYTVLGDRTHMENYFTEADVTRRRDHAISVMEETQPDSPALKKLKDGMAESLSLMNREYYAMRLMMDALGDTDMPEPVRNVALTEADSALPPPEKILLAQRMVHDKVYSEQKTRIRNNMAECIEALKSGTHGAQQETENKANLDLVWMVVLIFIQTASMIVMMWLTTHLGVNPVLSAVDHIKKDQTLPIIGASEFRYLAGTYNVMYNAYKKSIANLSFKASHDELTGAYNRAGFDLIKTSLDMSTTAMLLFDADQFKQVNDQHGHETGDKVLKKIADVLKKNFRSDDYICRIGGDEFVVFMVHPTGDPVELITRKVVKINEDLQREEEGLPSITLSAGVSYCPNGVDPAEMFRQADIALYYVKDHGRDGCCFYSEKLKGKQAPQRET